MAHEAEHKKQASLIMESYIFVMHRNWEAPSHQVYFQKLREYRCAPVSTNSVSIVSVMHGSLQPKIFFFKLNK
jgi:hypothetical protein